MTTTPAAYRRPEGMPENFPDRLMKKSELKAVLGYPSDPVLDALDRRGLLPSRRFGGSRRWFESDVLRFLERVRAGDVLPRRLVEG